MKFFCVALLLPAIAAAQAKPVKQVQAKPAANKPRPGPADVDYDDLAKRYLAVMAGKKDAVYRDLSVCLQRGWTPEVLDDAASLKQLRARANAVRSGAAPPFPGRIDFPNAFVGAAGAVLHNDPIDRFRVVERLSMDTVLVEPYPRFWRGPPRLFEFTGHSKNVIHDEKGAGDCWFVEGVWLCVGTSAHTLDNGGTARAFRMIPAPPEFEAALDDAWASHPASKAARVKLAAKPKAAAGN